MTHPAAAPTRPEAPRDAAAPLLDVRHLSLDFTSPRGRIHALRDISMTVPRGRIVGVVGESGSGKSTLAYAVIRLLAENARVVGGEIVMDGRDLLTLSPREMRGIRGRRMSMIFQDPMTSLNRVMSIGQQMIDIQYRDPISKAEKRKRAVEALRRVGIPDPEDRVNGYPHQFSGGMRQRICIAMAMMVEPALLLADEPTTALDATTEVQIIGLLERLQAEIGCSILFVSHHLGTVAELCHDVVVLYAGEVVEQGSVRDIFHNPGHPYTQALLDCDPGRIKEKTRRLPTIPGVVPSLVGDQVPTGCIFKTRCPHAFDRCDHEVPPSYAVVSGEVAPDAPHTARCHLRDAAEERRP
ncbi:Oligopeptide transport ATP-binding protein OppD [Caenispirillum salinarum AK4]|uniref:Oligopeptide transport ATP-binding protein OppD n=1 Tax=Caenispirillum salinarum AK4 TaxID=1238182 RepID=K9HNE9_9PROT|nr:ABC transporter ATP-binding protein [Caenispirillum salinarum]EKV31858.1 Oligopeptide transport ATP-binding protein OppD [Caenispirillum salinarum AK4]